MNPNQLKLKVNVTNKKDEKITTNFEPTNIDGVLKRTYLDKKLSKSEGHLSYKEKG